MPRKFATDRLRIVLLHLPRNKPHFVLTRSRLSESMNKPSMRISRNVRTHIYRQILSFNQRCSVDILQRARDSLYPVFVARDAAHIMCIKRLKRSTISLVQPGAALSRTDTWYRRNTFNSYKSDEPSPVDFTMLFKYGVYDRSNTWINNMEYFNVKI